MPKFSLVSEAVKTRITKDDTKDDDATIQSGFSSPDFNPGAPELAHYNSEKIQTNFVPAEQAQQTQNVSPLYIPTDPGFVHEWQIVNNSYPGMDLNVTKVWDEYKGAGVK